MAINRDLLLFKTKMAERAERYDDMVETITILVQEAENITYEERNLLASAYRYAVGSRRSSLRGLSHHKASLKKSNEAEKTQLSNYMKKYKLKIQEETQKLCQNILEMIDSVLLNKSTSPDCNVFYKKMKGDYYRYKSEVTESNQRAHLQKLAEAAYISALSDAKSDLLPNNAILLGVKLNYSVFLHEAKGEEEKAIELCKEALNTAIDIFDSKGKTASEDAAQIMQLLRDNITLWTAKGICVISLFSN
ncbi:hypothetical protein IE077_000475 [Cardiosporidium cionae]|uniref:14-3-3 domain-containing protein n=1 Tax=Cardiosporidium cionae TaxID=476202 RepID=A0ABQ7J966_9APIC|nr:hypothetical protein IE077_000475 [Cardiosporidium cionae]|eukprot:KAF8820501.1 hypothetical protein IE077_000475 [Cardiosporidium cionae]